VLGREHLAHKMMVMMDALAKQTSVAVCTVHTN